MRSLPWFARFAVIVWLLALSAAQASAAGSEVVAFTSDRWSFQGAQVVDYLGRKALVGTAMLKDVEFQDGTLEVDIAANGKTSYPGFLFRTQSPDEGERFYVRPHRLEAYGDVLQYTPVFNGNAGWQLYSGPGSTAGAVIPRDQWFHVRLEVKGAQARVFIGDSPTPALVVDHLAHGVSRGAVGLNVPADGSAYFSNFSYSLDAAALEFPPPAPVDSRPGIISNWSLSQAFKLSGLDMERDPAQQSIPAIEWRSVTADPSGLVDVSRYIKRSGQEPDCVIARTVVTSDRDETRELKFGYSDAVSVFLNGKILFSGNSAYRYRDPSFAGVVGLFDSVYLPLTKGENQLLLVVAEGFGGWGYICQFGDAVFQDPKLGETWKAGDGLKVPESAAYDPATGLVYVSNYDPYNPSGGMGRQFISRFSLDGKVHDLEWVGGLNNPAGVALAGNRLYVADRGGLVEIDIPSEAIVGRFPAPGAVAPNDVAIGPDGSVYVSDPPGNAIYRLTGSKLEPWLVGGGIDQPNGIDVDSGKLLVANNGDTSLKAVDLQTGSITTVARLSPGILDGLKAGKAGEILVSDWQGKLYRVSPGGDVKKILDTTAREINCADFDYDPDKGLVIVPTFMDNGLVAYTLGG